MATVIPGSAGADVLVGTDEDDIILGYAGDDFLYGFDGDDILNAGGGADHLEGGDGDDIYVFGSGSASIVELADEGEDTMYAGISVGLAANVENLILLGGTSAVVGLGNGLANVMVGNENGNVLSSFFGNDLLWGLAGADTLEASNGNDFLDGGLGVDLMKGGAGNDTYVVNVGSDKIDEVADAGAGVDTVQASVSYSLISSATLVGVVENLTLLNFGSAVNGTGNSANNVLAGNNFNNTLTGNGGSDTLIGGIGNDNLSGGAAIDRLTGGHGVDTLSGGAGNNIFVFNAPLGAANRDVITDFTNSAGNNDSFRLENAVMAEVGAAGTLNPAFFRAGAAALDANDAIVYNKASGTLFYDANGNLAGGTTLLATLTGKPTLTFADFVVI